MELIINSLPWVQVVLAIILVTVILLQQSSAGVGGAFGGGDGGAINHTRRGFEKLLFRATIVIAILFVLSTFIVILI